VKGGQCPVAWDEICRPRSLGGLGIKEMNLHGLALRARWYWLSRIDPMRPWQGLPMLKDAAALEIFHSFAKIKVGNGEKVFFWLDRWVNGRRIQEIAPKVFALIPTRKKTAGASPMLWQTTGGFWTCRACLISLTKRDVSSASDFGWSYRSCRGIAGHQMSSFGLDPNPDCTTRGTPTSFCVREDNSSACPNRSGDLSPRQSARCFVGSRRRGGYGRRTVDSGTVYKIRRALASFVCRRRTTLSILLCSVATRGRSGTHVYMPRD
jgi:hypothetical protein